MKMYVANCTAQIQDFQYRLPEKPRAFRQSIQIGGQVQLSGDLSTKDIEAVIEQHAKYGLVAVEEVDRTRDFTGLVFSLDKPVVMTKVRAVLEHNHRVLDARGRQIRSEAAVAVHDQIEQNNPTGLRGIVMEIEEVAAKKDGVSPTLHEITRVNRSEAPTNAPKGAKGSLGGRRRAA